MNADRWLRVKDVFHAALERQPQDRASYVAEACDGDAALRAEVERLLHAHAEADSFIEAPVSVAPVSSAQGFSPAVPETIGRYKLGRLIGAGGMGEVYAARDAELGRDVAVKIGSDTDLEGQARLRREAQHASRLNHPHICTIHEVGVWDGRAYIVMEYVEGESLSQVIPREGLETDRVLRYGMQIVDGLGHAHQHGVVHRDLKTENVAITRDGRAKILDFGLARRLPAQQLKELSESRASVTAGDVFAGTLSTMAPELLRGEEADERSDIWALGVLLYEMAAGARPFTGATGFELAAAVFHQPPPPLPATVPASLQNIIGRCLAKNPRERYQRAEEVRAALEAVQGEAARSSSSRRAIAVAAATLIAVAAVFMMMSGRFREARAPVAVGASGRPAVAVMQFENVTGAEEIGWMSRGVPNMLLTGLAQTRGLDIVSAQHLYEVIKQTGRGNLESLDRSQMADVARRAGAGAVVVGSFAKAGSEIRIDAQVEDLSSGRVLAADSVRGTDVFALVDQLAARIRREVGFRDAQAAHRVVDVSTSSLDAYRLFSDGLNAHTNARWVEAKQLFEKAVAVDPTFAEAYLVLMFTSSTLGLFEERDKYAAKAAEHADRLDERRRLFLRAETARQSGNYQEAVRTLDEMIAKYPDFAPSYTLGYLIYQQALGAVHDPAKLIEIMEAGVRAIPSSATLRNYYGYALTSEGRFGDAIREFEAYARVAPREPNPYDSLGEAHLVMGEPEKAIQFYSQALAVDPGFLPSQTGRALARSLLGDYERGVAEQSDSSVKALLLSRIGRYREAEELIAGDLRRSEDHKNPRDQGLGHLLLSVFALERKQAAVAIEQVRAAERAFEQLPLPRRRFFSVIAHTLGGVADLRAGRVDAARSRLAQQSRLFNGKSRPENWWHRLLETEIALALDDRQKAATAFQVGEPRGKMWFEMGSVRISFLANGLLFRDGNARAAKARGDLDEAIETYRQLLTVGPEQKWTTPLEPRYILEIARLLEQKGDRKAALHEYERFLEFWKRADSNLPELAEARRAAARLRSSS